MADNKVCELECNVDDMTAEEMSYALQRLMAAGAKDVFVTPVAMKKSRQGTLLTVVCGEEDRDRMIEQIFRFTSTIGIRETICRRYVLDRESEVLATPYGEVRIKTSKGYGVTRAKIEFDDLARIADEHDVSIAEARRMVEDYLK